MLKKSTDLKSPFSWENRHVLIEDRVWYVPDGYDQFETFVFPGWSDPSIFPSSQPVCVEYCSGNGNWITERALQFPQFNWVAVEKKFSRVKKIWAKMKNLKQSNLLIVCGEGLRVTKHYFPRESVQDVYINFPDPWPKTRHGKHRLMQDKFNQEMAAILKPKGTLTFVTDDPDYSTIVSDMFTKSVDFQSLMGKSPFLVDLPGYGESYFEDLWRSQGKIIRYHLYQKNSNLSELAFSDEKEDFP